MPVNTAQRDLLTEFQALASSQIARYADAYAGGRLSLSDFERLFKQEVKDMYIASIWIANGEATGTQAQYGGAGRRLRDQYGFMHDFFREIERGELSVEAVKARGGMYVSSSRQILEQAGNREAGLPTLPHYPGDGSTTCLSNCKCTISSEKVTQGYDVFWRTSAAEHCDDCRRRAERSPLRVRFGKVVNSEVWS